MTHVSRFTSSSLRGWRRLGLGVALLGSLALPLSAQSGGDEKKEEVKYTAVRAADADEVSVSSAGQLSLSMTRAPASAADAKIHVVNSNNYSLWSGPLTRVGGKWTAKLDLDAVEALLIANAIQAEFPGAATGGKDLRISFVRDMFGEKLGPTAALVKPNEPLFYEAPQAPEPLETVDGNADAIRMASYAMASRRYDEQLAAYYHQLVAAKASAHALWNDLKTAKRLPDWPDSLIAAQDRAFAALDAKAEEILAQREKHRQTAESVVNTWNSAHPDSDIDITFRAKS